MLALFISRLIGNDLLSEQVLAVIGIDDAELDALMQSLEDNPTMLGVAMELQLRAAIREYDKVIDAIIVDHDLDPGKRGEFRTALATFASDNSITDLEAAFKFYAATQPDDLGKFTV